MLSWNPYRNYNRTKKNLDWWLAKTPIPFKPGKISFQACFLFPSQAALARAHPTPPSLQWHFLPFETPATLLAPDAASLTCCCLLQRTHLQHLPIFSKEWGFALSGIV